MVGKSKNTWAKMPASKIVDLLIEQAIESGANFIHVEPTNDDVLVRFRIHGVLKEIDRIPKNRYISVVERLKALANLNIKERYTPQDGRLKTIVGDDYYTLRVSVLPTINGEKVAINLQKDSSTAPSLSELGAWGPTLDSINQAMNVKKGVILVTGPTDSGKSTSVFSMLSNLTSPEIGIATIEDPVEYHIKNATQTQVNQKSNLTFLSGLRAILKHDANVIMVSELRDSETAELVFDTALHGRLIITSVYSDNAASAISQLRNAGTNQSLIAHGLKLVTSQRLVRRLCQDCMEPYEPDKLTLIKIEDLFLGGNAVNIKRLHKLKSIYLTDQDFSTTKLSPKNMSTTEDKIKRLWRPHSGGCDNCNQTGYKGRVGLFEALNISPAIQKLIVSLASGKVINQQALKEGMITIQTDGLIKALAGVTSLDEILKFGIEDMII